MPRYMLDTNVFNRVLDGKVSLGGLEGKALVATHIQRDELDRCSDETRRSQLLHIFVAVINALSADPSSPADPGGFVPTESAAWDVSRWDQAKWGAEDELFGALRADLDARNKGKPNNVEDILIAETAMRNGWVLVTDDRDLVATVTKHGGACANSYIFNAGQLRAQA